MADPRKNLPSASGMERLKRCRGSWQLEQQLTQIETTEIAERGTLIHSALDGTVDSAMLDDQELFIYEKCREYEEAIVNVVFGYDSEILERLIVTGEERIFLTANDTELMSGQFDKLYRDPVTGICLIVDYKTGYKAVTDPDANMQLRAYAVLVAEKYEYTSIHVAAIQPMCKPFWSKCEYLPEHIGIARQEILHLIATAKMPEPPITPGLRQCEYCKAKSTCKELAAFSVTSISSVSKVHEIILMPSQELDKREMLISGDELSRLLDISSMLEKWLKAIKEEAMLRLRTGRAVPNYGMFPGRAMRKINSPYEFYAMFKEFGKEMNISPKEIIDETATFGIGKVEELVNKNKKFKKAQMKDVLNDLFPDMIGTTSPDTTIKRIKEED